MRSSITAKKSLGQNFLTNPRILDKIVAVAEITKKDIVLEIGPGTGNLTQKLAEKAGRVIAVEKDRRLIENLKEKFKNVNVEIAEGDILKLDIWALFRNSDYKVVGNIPYYITSRLLRKIFEEWPKPKLIVLTIQKEVAQRIVGLPPHSSLLSVGVQFFSEPKVVGHISKENFRPRPKVDSAIIRLIPKEKLPAKDIDGFFRIVRAGFSQKRKVLAGNLTKLGIKKESLADAFKKTGIPGKARAENLSLGDWIKLSNEL